MTATTTTTAPAVRHLADYDTANRFGATLVATQRLNPGSKDPEVRELTLELELPEIELAVGQSLALIVPGDPQLGKREHVRLYSVADLPERGPAGKPLVRLCVRRCSSLDEFTGERWPGVASSYLCDLQPGARLTVSGPFGIAWEVPSDHAATLVLIGTGTGIAPFRAFVRHLHRDVADWHGKVWLLYGAKSGLELLYQNDERDDFTQYYDRGTFEAFRALSPRPEWADPIGWDYAIGARAEELWALVGSPHTWVYIAGLEPMRAELEKVFEGLAGSKEAWRKRKAELVAARRWVELIY